MIFLPKYTYIYIGGSYEYIFYHVLRSIGTVVISEFNYKTAIWDNSKTISSAPAIVIPVFILKP
jgi:hypothetical protein